jgi:hypothetical protein
MVLLLPFTVHASKLKYIEHMELLLPFTVHASKLKEASYSFVWFRLQKFGIQRAGISSQGRGARACSY